MERNRWNRPRWLAWVSLLLALWLVIGPIGWLALLFGLPLWTLLVSVLLLRRDDSEDTPAEPAGIERQAA